MDSALWSAIEGMRQDDAQAEERFVELVLPTLYPFLETDSEKLGDLCAQLGKYSRVLKPRDDFWAWVKQQYPPLSGVHRAKEPPESVRLQVLSRVKIALRQRQLLPTLGEIPGKLFLSGWAPAFFLWLAVFSFFDKPFRGDSAWIEILGSSVLGATLFSILVSPFLSRWRRWLRVRNSGIASCWISTLVVLVVMSFVSLSLEFIAAHTDREFGYSYAEAEVTRLFAPFTLELVQRAIWGHTFFTIVAFVVLLLWPYASWTKKKPWLINRAASWWRQLLSVLLCLPALWQLYTVSDVVWDGWALDPELEALGQSYEPPRFHYFQEIEKDDTTLLEEFLEDPRAVDYYSSQDGEGDGRSAEGVWQAWLEVGSELWSRDKWWLDPKFPSLATMALPQFATEESKEISPALLEARLRQMFLLDKGSAQDYSLFCRQLSQARLSPQEWVKISHLLGQLVDLAPKWLLELDEGSFFAFQAASLNELGAKDSSFRILKLRAELNRAWRSYKARLSQDFAPMTPQQVEKLNSLQFGVEQRLERQQTLHFLAAATIICEVQWALSESRPLPANLGEFESARALEVSPYFEWLTYTSSEREIQISVLGLQLYPYYPASPYSFTISRK